MSYAADIGIQVIDIHLSPDIEIVAAGAEIGRGIGTCPYQYAVVPVSHSEERALVTHHLVCRHFHAWSQQVGVVEIHFNVIALEHPVLADDAVLPVRIQDSLHQSLIRTVRVVGLKESGGEHAPASEVVHIERTALLEQNLGTAPVGRHFQLFRHHQ